LQRREFLKGLLTLGGTGLAATFMQSIEAAGESPSIPLFSHAIYAYLYDDSGNWIPTESPEDVVRSLDGSGAAYIDNVANQSIPSDTSVLQQLVKAGLKLSLRLNPFSQANTNPKPIDAIFQQAQEYYETGLFSYVFIDHALLRPDVQDVVNAVKRAGFNLVATNETSGTSPTPTGVWLHEKAFAILQGGDTTPDLGKHPDGITPKDSNWVQSVHSIDPGSHAVLKLEAPTEIDAFTTLPLNTQQQLLTLWSQNQQKYEYVTIYPWFYVSYDCISSNSCSFIANLMNQYDAAVSATSVPEFASMPLTMLAGLSASLLFFRMGRTRSKIEQRQYSG